MGGLRIAKLHYNTILPSSVFTFVPWAPKNFLGSKSPCAKSAIFFQSIRCGSWYSMVSEETDSAFLVVIPPLSLSCFNLFFPP